MVRHFLRDDDITPAEQRHDRHGVSIQDAIRLAARPHEGPKPVALIFDRPSPRPRVALSVGVAELGGTPMVIQGGESQLGAKESIADTARVLERMVSAIVWRTFAQSNVEEMAAGTTVPVINSLTDDFHPCQILADLQTITEHKGDPAGLTVAFVGDGSSNMSNSYLVGCAMAGMHVRVATPADYQPLEDAVASARRIAGQTGGSFLITDDPVAAVSGADVVITDTWVSMGLEAEKAARVATFGPYRVTPELFEQAKPDAIFLHCLPAYREYEVDSAVIDGPRSVIWDEAENRLHAQKALLEFLLTA